MSTGVPWTAIVGIVGIAGTVVTAHLANRAAERRLQLEHQEADRTRFHSIRVEVYIKLITAIRALRMTIADARPRAHGLTGDDAREVIDSLEEAISAVIASAQMVAFVSSSSTRQAATDLIEAMLSLSTDGMNGDADFVALTRRLDETEAAFSESARAELLPSGDA